jgi:hypothetical protein
MWFGLAAIRRAMNPIFTVPVVCYFDLASGKCSFAQDTNPLVVQRAPVSEGILVAQNRQPIFEMEMCFHVRVSAPRTSRTSNAPQSVSQPVGG